MPTWRHAEIQKVNPRLASRVQASCPTQDWLAGARGLSRPRSCVSSSPHAHTREVLCSIWSTRRGSTCSTDSIQSIRGHVTCEEQFQTGVDSAPKRASPAPPVAEIGSGAKSGSEWRREFHVPWAQESPTTCARLDFR